MFEETTLDKHSLNTPSNASIPHLLRLPLELQQEIFSNVVPHVTSPTPPNFREIDDCPDQALGAMEWFTGPAATSILRVSHALSSAALDYMYSRSLFTIGIHLNPDTGFAARFQKRIQNKEYEWTEVPFVRMGGGDWKEYGLDSEVLAEKVSLENFKRIRWFVVTIHMLPTDLLVLDLMLQKFWGTAITDRDELFQRLCAEVDSLVNLLQKVHSLEFLRIDCFFNEGSDEDTEDETKKILGLFRRLNGIRQVVVAGFTDDEEFEIEFENHLMNCDG
ncbi:hypothetical protein EV356DRAFT_535047 [Viridothelium virens]|uniref:F-box domain-containing protein n=1 Tax=Viridothelium virens TaxID=1048519 RepID=A0A6A6H2T9_VIRVR|nr:hypothetical protein EV356DRAFT_535047 [Viridothelium virens]